MSSSNPSDPRLLLPEWLRDGEAPLPAPIEPTATKNPVAVVEVVTVPEVVAAPAIAPATPYSDRLSLDTRLDPAALVSADDLPTWLGGLERHTAIAAAAPAAVVSAPVAPRIEDPEPYEGVDAPDEGVVDVEINGWYVIAGAVGLLILLAAALRLYLS